MAPFHLNQQKHLLLSFEPDDSKYLLRLLILPACIHHPCLQKPQQSYHRSLQPHTLHLPVLSESYSELHPDNLRLPTSSDALQKLLRLLLRLLLPLYHINAVTVPGNLQLPVLPVLFPA